MDFCGTDDATLQQWYADAMSALAQVMTGAKATTISLSQAGGARSVTYNQTNLADLRAWIAMLANEMRGRGLLSCTPSRRRAIGIKF